MSNAQLAEYRQKEFKELLDEETQRLELENEKFQKEKERSNQPRRLVSNQQISHAPLDDKSLNETLNSKTTEPMRNSWDPAHKNKSGDDHAPRTKTPQFNSNTGFFQGQARNQLSLPINNNSQSMDRMSSYQDMDASQAEMLGEESIFNDEQKQALKFSDFETRNKNKVYFKLVEANNKRWCMTCKGLKLPNRDFAIDMDEDGKVDLADLELKKQQLFKLGKIPPADFTMKKFNIDATQGQSCVEWWESLESNLPEGLQIVTKIRSFFKKEPPTKIMKKKDKMSYRELQRAITTYHPIDPDTGDRFSFDQNVTVNRYNLKLIDCCFCIVCMKGCKKCGKDCIRCYRSIGKQQTKSKKQVKPDSMQDVPDSPQSDDASDYEDPYKGLDNAAILLGEGSVLYLQIMKTLTYLFLLLSIINLPIMIALSDFTVNNDYANFQSSGQYFTVGNVGQKQVNCDYAYLDYELGSDIRTNYNANNKDPLPDTFLKGVWFLEEDWKAKQINLACKFEWQYINTISKFGFINQMSTYSQRLNSAAEMCSIAHDPSAGSEFRMNQEQFELYKKLSKRELYEDTQDVDEIDTECELEEDLLNPKYDKDLIKSQLESKCLGKNTCNIDLREKAYGDNKDQSIESMVSDKCLKKILGRQVTSIQFMAINDCSWDFYQWYGREVHKLDFMLIYVTVDIISIIIIFLFIDRLNSINQEYLDILERNIVKLSKFTIEIRNIKLDKTVQDMRILKMKLWLHFTRVIKKCVDRPEDQMIEDPSDENFGSSFDSDSLIEDPFEDEKDEKGSDLKQDILAKQKNYDRNKRMNQNNQAAIQIKEELQIQKKLKSKLNSTCAVADIQVSFRTKIDEELLLMQKEQTIINEAAKNIKKSSNNGSKARSLQSQKLAKERYVKHEEIYENLIDETATRRPGAKIPKKDFIDQVDYVWITFTNNDVPETIIKLFRKEEGPKAAIRFICCKDNKVRQVTKFSQQELEVDKAIEPDQIIWNNLPHSVNEQNRFFRLMIFAAFVIFLAAFYLQVFIEASEDVTEFVECKGSLATVTAKNAYLTQKFDTERIKLLNDGKVPEDYEMTKDMVCYCQRSTYYGFFFWNGYDTEQFRRFEEDKSVEIPQYCLDAISRSLNSVLVTQASDFLPAILDSIISYTFSTLTTHAMIHTSVKLQSVNFLFIIVLETFNKGFILLLKSLDVTGTVRIIEHWLAGEETDSSLFTGEDIEKFTDGFVQPWYAESGADLVFTILVSILLTNWDEVQKIIKFSFSQWHDRGFSSELKRDPDDENNDEPNTKKDNMDDLIELYQGETFEGDSTFSRFGSTLVICLMFASGMPILYIVSFIFFFLTFLSNKYALFKYYQTCTQLDRVIPQVSMPFITFALYLHMIFGVAMFGNTSLVDFRDGPSSEWTFLDWFALPNYEGYFPHFYQKMYCIFVFGFFGLKITTLLTGSFLRLLWEQIQNLFTAIRRQLQACFRPIQRFFCPKDRSRQQNKKNKRQQDAEKDQDMDHEDIDEEDESSLESDDSDDSEMSEASALSENKDVKTKVLEKLSPTKINNSKTRFLARMKSAEIEDVVDFQKINVRRMSVDKYRQEKVSDVNTQLLTMDARMLIDRLYNHKPLVDARLKPEFNKIIYANMLSKDERKAQLEEVKKKITNPYKANNIYIEFNIKNLVKMYERSIKELEDFLLFFGIENKQTAQGALIDGKDKDTGMKKDIRVNYEELCYSAKISFEEVHYYISLLLQRKQRIEYAIDDHFFMMKDIYYEQKRKLIEHQIRKDSSLKKTLNKQKAALKKKKDQSGNDGGMSARSSHSHSTNKSSVKTSKHSSRSRRNKINLDEEEEKRQQASIKNAIEQDKDLKFMEYTPERKLKLLFKYEQELLKADRQRKENRRGLQTICRMTGSIDQSYFMFDQQINEVAREILFKDLALLDIREGGEDKEDEQAGAGAGNKKEGEKEKEEKKDKDKEELPGIQEDIEGENMDSDEREGSGIGENTPAHGVDLIDKEE